MVDIKKILFDNKDLEYKEFHSKLMPTFDPSRIIGVRMPVLRSIAKRVSSDDVEKFLSELPHFYYEENNLHAILVQNENNFEVCVKRLEAFLPFVDNWATCDALRPKCFCGKQDDLLPFVEKWLKSDKLYTVRFAVGMLMAYYLDEKFEERFFEEITAIKSDEYYVKMAIAWYFATALAKRYDSAIKIIEENRLDKWTHNKTIQKAIESFRVEKEKKEYLKTLKRN